MKKNIKFLFGLMFFLNSNQGFAAGNQPMFSILSWNILGPSTFDVEKFNFKKGDYLRLDAIIDIIKKSRASILCLQEVDLKALDILKKNFQDFTFVDYCMKGDAGGVVIFFKTKDFERGGTFASGLPCENDTPPFTAKDGAFVSGLLKSKKTGAQFLVSSVHISRSHNNSDRAKGEKQLKAMQEMLLRFIPSQSNVYKIFAGDFNTSADEIQNFTLKFLGQQDGKVYSEAFAHAVTSNAPDGVRNSIDHIFYSQGLSLVDRYSKVINDGVMPGMMIHQLYPSDHFPLYAVFEDPINGSFFVKASAPKMPNLPQPNQKQKMTRQDWLRKYKKEIDFAVQNFNEFMLQQIVQSDGSLHQYLQQFEIDALEQQEAASLKKDIVAMFLHRLQEIQNTQISNSVIPKINRSVEVLKMMSK